MRRDEKLSELFAEIVKKRGPKQTRECLLQLLNEANETKPILTIIANQSLHEIPKQYLHGEIFVASKGNLDFSSQKKILASIKKVLIALKEELGRKVWQKVYLVPTGHPALALQIKNLVYHVLRLDTVDLLYSGGCYYEVEIKRADFL